MALEAVGEGEGGEGESGDSTSPLRVGVAWVEAVENTINPPPGGAKVHCRPPPPEPDAATPLPCQRIVFALLERAGGPRAV